MQERSCKWTRLGGQQQQQQQQLLQLLLRRQQLQQLLLLLLYPPLRWGLAGPQAPHPQAAALALAAPLRALRLGE